MIMQRTESVRYFQSFEIQASRAFVKIRTIIGSGVTNSEQYFRAMPPRPGLTMVPTVYNTVLVLELFYSRLGIGFSKGYCHPV